MTLFILVIIAILVYYLFIHRTDAFGKPGVRTGMKCPNCHNSVNESFNVCPICKETLKRKCPNCGEKLDASWKFCPYCETDINGSGRK